MGSSCCMLRCPAIRRKEMNGWDAAVGLRLTTGFYLLIYFSSMRELGFIPHVSLVASDE